MNPGESEEEGEKNARKKEPSDPTRICSPAYTPQLRASCLAVFLKGVMARMGTEGRPLLALRTVLPRRVKQTRLLAAIEFATCLAARVMASVGFEEQEFPLVSS